MFQGAFNELLPANANSFFLMLFVCNMRI